MKWTFFFGAVVFLCFALLACTTAPGPSDDRLIRGVPFLLLGRRKSLWEHQRRQSRTPFRKSKDTP